MHDTQAHPAASDVWLIDHALSFAEINDAVVAMRSQPQLLHRIAAILEIPSQTAAEAEVDGQQENGIEPAAADLETAIVTARAAGEHVDGDDPGADAPLGQKEATAPDPEVSGRREDGSRLTAAQSETAMAKADGPDGEGIDGAVHVAEAPLTPDEADAALLQQVVCRLHEIAYDVVFQESATAQRDARKHRHAADVERQSAFSPGNQCL